MTPKEYLSKTCNCIKKPRLVESPKIYKQFNKLGSYILPENKEPILILDCYTTRVYPRFIQLPDYKFVAWDNHFWDIYGRFLFMYFCYANIGSKIPQSFFVNYYKSMLLVFLANRNEKYPAFSRYIAEEYSKMDMKFPHYNEYEDINDMLDKIGHQQEFNISRIFGFCHEISHIAFRKNNKLSQVIQKSVITYCECGKQLIEASKKYNLVPNDVDEEQANEMLKIYSQILSESDKRLLEEVCCDIMAIHVLFEYFKEECKMNPEQIDMSLSSIFYFWVCSSWLSSSENFWNGMIQVYTDIRNDDAFVNKKNPYYNLGTNITDEYAVRISFVSSYCMDKLEINLFKNISDEVYRIGFVDIMEKARGIDIMENVLNKTKNAKTDYVHSIFHLKKKNQLIGWENE